MPAVNDTRPNWDQWGLMLAATVALRADCTRRQVGAVLMDSEHRIVATGYNGAPSKYFGCLTMGACPRGQMSTEDVAPGSSYDTGAGTCIAIHAEQNALLRASWHEMDGATLYVTDAPCEGCLRMIKATPVKRVMIPDPEHEIRMVLF